MIEDGMLGITLLGDDVLMPENASNLDKNALAERIYERDTDALFLRLLRERKEFSALFAALIVGAIPSGTPTIQAQRRHVASSGTIDLVVQYAGGPRFLIENKIDAAYSVTRAGHGQPLRYQKTTAAYREKGEEVYSVLLAPRRYLASSRSSQMFDRRVAYEDLRTELRDADLAVLEAAIQQSEAPYEPIPNEGAGTFFSSIRRLIEERFTDLVMKRDPNADGVRPEHSRTIYFDSSATLVTHTGVPRPKMSLQCWDSNAPSASVKIMMPNLARVASVIPSTQELVDIGGYLRSAGRSLGIVIDTPRLYTQWALADQIDDVAEALEAALRLQK